MLSDCRGVPTSSNSAEAIKTMETAHHCALVFKGDAVGEIDIALEAQPDFVMGYCFKAAMLTQEMETRIYSILLKSVEAAEALWSQANERERDHIQAVRAWVDGDFHGAVQHWEAALTRHPLDLLALQMVHLSDVLLGDVVGQRIARLGDESLKALRAAAVIGKEFELELLADVIGAEGFEGFSATIRVQAPGEGVAGVHLRRHPGVAKVTREDRKSVV